jgi:hypothetical protein
VIRLELLTALVAIPCLMQTPQPVPLAAVGIEASLGGQTFALQERVPLRLVIHNLSVVPISVSDPTSSVQIHLRLPSGQETSIDVGHAFRGPGVPDISVPVGVPPHNNRQFEFDVGGLVNLDQPGTYSLRVEYEWRPGATWQSADLPFTLTKPAPMFLTITPSEASRGGYHTAMWAEREGDTARVLASEFRIQDLPPRVEGAREIARVPATTIPSLSMEPPQLPFAGRWIAWIREGRLYTLYDSQMSVERIAPSSVPLPAANSTLIDPLLADQPPGEGRPAVAAGMVLRGTKGAEFQLAEVDRSGQARFLSPIPLAGDVIRGWATSVNAANRVFVIALQVANQIQVVGISCAKGRACSSPFLLLRTDEGLLDGDIRPGPAQQLFIGLLLKQGANWKRLTLARSASGQVTLPVETPLRGCDGAVAIKARLDEAGKLGVAYLCNQQIHYAPPAGNEAAGIGKPLAEQVKFFELTFRPNLPPAFLLYLAQSGPEFAAIP